ncbi:hypothetical protein [Sciscionella sediminilitoris]|uniref:hypothetical protein n=1 Tax=Sciscionella sediminilitoris TaxID=1445613 RepID=UPI0004DFC845|nr:hypothetical protein [Sciscionella sp. SE31]
MSREDSGPGGARHGLAVAGLVLGVLGAGCACLPFLGVGVLPLMLAAPVLSALGLALSFAGRARGLWIAGLGFSALGLVVSLA